jgi:hypothetical protein
MRCCASSSERNTSAFPPFCTEGWFGSRWSAGTRESVNIAAEVYCPDRLSR